MNPGADPVLISLKRIALSGRGEYGPLYDQGVLSVIQQIETTGSFTPSPLTLMCSVNRVIQLDANALSHDEIAQATAMAQARGWTLEEGARYAAGVQAAESALAFYRTEAGGV
jgi:hypothetical protein